MYFRLRGEKPFISGNACLRSARQAVDHLSAPDFPRLPIEDIAADLPIELYQFSVDGQRGAQLCRLNPAFYTPFNSESSIPAFKKAITDTIEAINTGVHRLRDGTEIRRIPNRRHSVKPVPPW